MGNVVKPKFHYEEEVCIEVITEKEGGLRDYRRERRRNVKVHDKGEKKMPRVKLSLERNKSAGALEFGETSPSNNKNMQIEKYQGN